MIHHHCRVRSQLAAMPGKAFKGEFMKHYILCLPVRKAFDCEDRRVELPHDGRISKDPPEIRSLPFQRQDRQHVLAYQFAAFDSLQEWKFSRAAWEGLEGTSH